MGLIGNNQSFVTGASGVIPTAAIPFQRAMDTVLVDLGRDITLHLPPTKSPCVSPTCQFDSFYKKFVGVSGIVCEMCRGQGFVLEPRYTVYRANIRWSDLPFNNSSFIDEREREFQSVGRITQNFVRTKTVAASHDDIRNSVGATIDGHDVEVFNEPRQTGWGQNLLYTITVWKRVNR